MATNVVVENREGAGGVVGTTYAARAPADGRSILMSANPPFVIAPLTQKTAAYDPLASFVPIARVGSVPLVLITSAHSPVNDFEQMKRFVKANPDKANYASSGIGSPGQVYTELIKKTTGLAIQEVPYKSTSQALIDVIGGNVLLSLVSIPAALPHIKSGALRVLAIGSPQRLSDFPGVPTIAEAIGEAGFEAGVWYGFFAPVGTPPEVVQMLYAEIAKAQANPEIRGVMGRSNVVPQLQNTSQFAASLKADVAVARQLVESANLGAGNGSK
jgi:tripartite-type tricarboxylate transporter receptor subunit TctC